VALAVVLLCAALFQGRLSVRWMACEAKQGTEMFVDSQHVYAADLWLLAVVLVVGALEPYLTTGSPPV
jgi:hypothetical protein